MPPRVPPWKKAAPQGKAKVKLRPEQKARAKALAEAAGRRYPNLIDNMRVLAEDRRSGKR